MSTILSRSVPDILAHLAQLRPTLAGKGPLLYAISATHHTPPADLTALHAAVTALAPDGRAAGCLSAPVPVSTIPTVRGCREREQWQRRVAVAVAAFDSARATLFRSAIPGRAPVQVGRWRAPGLHGQGQGHGRDVGAYTEEIGWSETLARFSGEAKMPEALQSLEYVGMT